MLQGPTPTALTHRVIYKMSMLSPRREVRQSFTGRQELTDDTRRQPSVLSRINRTRPSYFSHDNWGEFYRASEASKASGCYVEKVAPTELYTHLTYHTYRSVMHIDTPHLPHLQICDAHWYQPYHSRICDAHFCEKFPREVSIIFWEVCVFVYDVVWQ